MARMPTCCGACNHAMSSPCDVVTLSTPEREQLADLIAAGAASARKLMPARILLKADRGVGGPGWVDTVIAEAVEIRQPTVARVRRQYVAQGLEAALTRRAPHREYR